MAKSQVLIELQLIQKGGKISIAAKDLKNVDQQTKNVDKSTKNLNKTQQEQYTRQKQGVIQTANSTKNFSKMQQSVDGGGGAGGLVRAYALLAANVFALTAAFGVLSRSAQVDTLIQSMEILSTTGGTYIKNLARDMQEASGFAIDLAQSFRQVSLAASAGLNTKEIEGLTMVAKGAAISLGRNLPDAMDRIFRGAIKLEPEILDEIGLFVRVDEAAQKYGRQLGKTVSSMTQTEKRQAFLNEILDQGTKKFQQYAEEVKPDVYSRLAAALADIAQEGLSLLNSVLGPVINFIAGSQTLLVTAFGGLVFMLLKKAIPALGIMTQSAAENAQQAAKNARDYTAGVKASTAAHVEEENKKLKATKGRLEAERKAFKEGTGPRSKAAGAKAVDAELKKTNDRQKRLNLLKKKELQLEKQIGRSNAKNSKLLEKDLKMVKAELTNLKEQERVTRQIAANKKKGQVDPAAGSLAVRRQAKLDVSAGSAMAIASAAGVQETQGMAAAWGELNDQLDKGYDTATETGKSYTGMQKAGMKAKGAVTILGGGISKLMAIMGPWIMAFTMLMPLIIAFGKWLGLGSEEAKKFDDSLGKAKDQLKDIDKRFKAQTEAMNNSNLSWREQNKALLAFSKEQTGVATSLQNVIDDLKEFQKEATTTANVWEWFKSGFGWDRESLALDQINIGLKEMARAAVATGDESIIRSMSSAGITGVEALQKAQEVADIGMKKWNDTISDNEFLMKANSLAGNKWGKVLEDVAKVLGGDLKRENALFNGSMIGLERVMPEAAKAVNEYLDSQLGVVEVLDTINVTTIDQAENILPQIIKAFEEWTKVTETFESALAGAEESVGKFQASFMPKTKVDEVLSSFKQIEGAYSDLATMDEERAEAFFKDLANTPLAPLFADLAKEVKTGVDEKTGKDIFETIIPYDEGKARFKFIKEQFMEFQETIIATKIEIQGLNATIQYMSELSSKAGKAGEIIAKKQTLIAEKELDISKANTNAFLISKGYSEEKAKSLIDQVGSATTLAEVEEKLIAFGIAEQDMLQFKANFNAEFIKFADQQVAIETESLRIKKANLEAQKAIIEAQKALNDAKITGLTLEAKVSAMSKRGTMDLNAAETSKIERETAKLKLESTLLELEARQAMADVEQALLIAKVDVYERLGLIEADQATSIRDSINKAAKLSSDAVTQLINNAKNQFSVDLFNSVKTGYGGGMYEGIKASQEAENAHIQQLKEDRKNAVVKAEQEAKDKLAKMGISGGTGYDDYIDRAGKRAGKEFDKNNLSPEQVAADAAMARTRSTMMGMAEDMKKLGPEGEFVAAVVQGAYAISDAYSNMSDVLNDKGASAMEKGAAIANFAAQSLSQIAGMMAANSKAQIAEIDKQIEAEKKRDGKSAESLAKIKMLEKKKEAMERKAFERNKKMQMATVIASTAAAVMQTLAASGVGFFATPLAMLVAAMGAAQLAIISKTKFEGGDSSSDIAKPQQLNIGKAANKIDVSRGAQAGEIGYLRGQRGAPGGAVGMKSYAAGGEGILVGEQGPEIVKPTREVDVIPNDRMGTATNVNFTINAVDATGVEQLLVEQRGNIIEMIRDAANNTGERFLEDVDTQAMGSTGGGYGG